MRNEIIKLLCLNKCLKGVKLPQAIEFSQAENRLFIKLTNVCGNMQENESAFEGWIICLRSWLPNVFNSVVLDWDKPTNENKNEHYNRFLFRVIQFKEMYDWFSYAERHNLEIQDFELLLKSDLIINYPNSSKQNSKSDHKVEDRIESIFVNNILLKDRLQLDILNQQLPVGVFKGIKSNNTRIFTGQKSAIDLWGVKGDEFSIFQLKYQNIKVGIVSELLFYLGLMRAVFLSGNIKYPVDAGSVNYRDFEKIHYKKFKRLTGYFLVDKLHPLISKESINLINEGLSRLGDISIKELFYVYESGKISFK